ncbi:MAG: hypothetical protein R3B51_11800 [Thermodesulfobacteriota bacterium]
MLVNWVLGVSFILFGMMGTGKMLLGSTAVGLFMAIISIISGITVYLRLRNDLKDQT